MLRNLFLNKIFNQFFFTCHLLVVSEYFFDGVWLSDWSCVAKIKLIVPPLGQKLRSHCNDASLSTNSLSISPKNCPCNDLFLSSSRTPDKFLSSKNSLYV
ncbi:hypothetical protein BpHYR1_048511 [Brachionus plicatilis]|uniref:Uncharacterized protein n=1 Tax=Brachionus plicatilis TaxID=10195 RepID=A0A3M7SCG0_BRAPC|nr:hypothetical protein BpHYR1_048511 [Brachionus plicatilis]